MKKNIVSKLLSITLASCLIIGGVSFGGIKSVNAAGNSDTLYLKASDMNDGKVYYYDTDDNTFSIGHSDGYQNVNIDVDEDITFGTFYCGVNLVFSGNHNVIFDNDLYGIEVHGGDLTVNKGVTFISNDDQVVEALKYDGKGGNLYFYGKLEGKDFYSFYTDCYALFSGASINLDSCRYLFYDSSKIVDIIDSDISITNCEGDFINCKAVKIKNSSIDCGSVQNNLIYAHNTITLEDSSIKVVDAVSGIRSKENINISMGNINITSYYSALDADGNIDINGGNLVLNNNSDSPAVFASGQFTFNGDYCKVTSPCRTIDANGGIIMADDCYIDSPKGATIRSFSIYNSDGSICKDVELREHSNIMKPKDSEGEDKTKEQSTGGQGNESQSTGSQSGATQSTGSQGSEAQSGEEVKRQNEWVDGKWYDADGKQTYSGTMSWKSNDKGWWIEDSEGWYPVSQWQKIDGKWYYFTADGYMDYSEYRDGCWLGSDGAWVEDYYGGTWKQDSSGWWYEDASGWYPQSQWVWIDGVNYYFNARGYWK